MFKTAPLLFIALGSSIFSAPTLASPIYGVFNMNLDFGGDKMVEAVTTDGKTVDVTAGRGLYLAGGVGKTLDDGKYDTQFTVGWKYTGINASNLTVDWTRFPIEALAYINQNNLRLGGGVMYSVNNSLKASGLLEGNAKFDNALGFVLETQYRIGSVFLIGARATIIDYTINGSSLDGNSIGASMSFQFAK